MAANERDTTGDWLLPATGGPPTMFEIERRVDLALAVARAAETAALEIGAASLESAQQARRAADLAERASAAVAGHGPVPTPSANGQAAPVEIKPAPKPEPEPALDHFQERLLAFRERAERVSVRLRRLDGATPISSA